jgi:hypothetical protein
LAGVVGYQHDLGACWFNPRKIFQKRLGCIADHVNTARESRGRQLVLAKPGEVHGALCEVMMSDAHAHLARRVRDRMVFATASLPDKRQNTWLLSPKEVRDLSDGNRRCQGTPRIR